MVPPTRTVSVPIRKDNALYSDPRYYGEESQRSEGTITGGANDCTNPKGPDPSTPKATPKCNTATPDVSRTSTSTQSALEMVDYSSRVAVETGYTIPMQMQEVLVDARDADAATQPTVTPNPSYSNPPSRADLESDGYSDPRYYGENGRKPEATRGKVAGEGNHSTPTKSDEKFQHPSLENDLYSDPRYYGEEGRRPEAIQGKVAGEGRCQGYGVGVGSTKVSTEDEDGYTNPMQMQEILVDARDADAATQQTVTPNPSYSNTPSRADLESDGYSDPRYYGEEGRSSEATRGTITGGANDYTNPNGPDPSSPKAAPKSNTATPEVSRTSTSTQSALETDGYSDPRYYAST